MKNYLNNIQYSIIKLLPHHFFDDKFLPAEYSSGKFNDYSKVKKILDKIYSDEFSLNFFKNRIINYKSRIHTNMIKIGYKIEDGDLQLYAIIAN